MVYREADNLLSKVRFFVSAPIYWGMAEKETQGQMKPSTVIQVPEPSQSSGVQVPVPQPNFNAASRKFYGKDFWKNNYMPC